MDGLVGSQRGSPAQGMNLFQIVGELGNIADPAAVAAGVTDFGVQSHGGDDHFGNFPNRGLSFNAQIEKVDFVVGVVDDKQNGVDEILDVKIRLGLFAIAEDFQFKRVLPQLFDKVMQNAVCGAFAANIWKTGNESLNAIVFGKAGNDAFAGQLAGAVMRSGKKRALVFADFCTAGLSVDGGGGREHQPFDVMSAHGFQYAECGKKGHVQVNFGIGVAAGDVRIGSQMKDHVKPVLGKNAV